MAIELKHCLECGKLFRPCITKINGVLTWRRRWCSEECYMKALSKMDEPTPIEEPASIMVDNEVEVAVLTATKPVKHKKDSEISED